MLISEKYKLVWDSNEDFDNISKEVIRILNFEEKEKRELDYRSIVLLRNPYQKVLNFYMEKVLSNITPIFKDKKNDYIKHFRKWISKIFICEKLVISLRFENTVEKYSKNLNQLKIQKLDYNFLLRDETLLLDLKKIDENFNISDINTEYKWKIKEFYDYDTAKMIFNFYKNDFLIGEYDPFSFSSKNLNKEEKIDFIHKPF